MDILIVKSLVLLLMLIVTLICSMLPVAFIRQIHKTDDLNERSKYQAFLSILSCIAGGVFMGTCLLDLFPDVQEQIEIILDHYKIGGSFPVAEFVVVFGLLLVLVVEQIVIFFKEQSLITRSSGQEALLSSSDDARKDLLNEHRFDGLSCEADLSTSFNEARPSITLPYTEGTHGHNHIFDEDLASHSSIRSFLLLVAISLHSVFEGMAVGLQKSIDNVMALFFVVIFHKGIIAFSLSLNMVQSRLSLKQIISCNIFFCVTAPIGLAIGMGIMEMQDSPLTSIVSGVLQGMACGTFLYVTFFEVLPHEFNKSSHRLQKLLATVFGFMIVCGMLYINPEDREIRCIKSSD